MHHFFDLTTQLLVKFIDPKSAKRIYKLFVFEMYTVQIVQYLGADFEYS